MVFVSGQAGRHPVSGEVAKDVREQTRNVLVRIKRPAYGCHLLCA